MLKGINYNNGFENYITINQPTRVIFRYQHCSIQDISICFPKQNKNLSYSVKIADFQNSIEDELRQINEENSAGLDSRDPSNRLTFDLFNYHNLAEIDQYLSATESAKADLAVDFSLKSVATTHEGRPIKLISISSKDKR